MAVVPGRKAGRPAPLQHVGWLIELGHSLGVNVEEAKRQLRMADGDYEKGAIERAFTRVRAAADELDPAIRMAFGRALKDVGREVDRVGKTGTETKAAREALEEARRSIASGRFREAREATEACVTALSPAPTAPDGVPVRVLKLPVYPVARRESEDDEPAADDRFEFEYLKREVEHSIAGIRTTGQSTESEVRALAHATSVWFAGNHARALDELKSCGSRLERRMSALTPALKCSIIAPTLGIRAGKQAKIDVVMKNTSQAEAVDVRLSVAAGDESHEVRLIQLAGGAEVSQTVKLTFVQPGDFTVTAQAKFQRAFDAREYESVAVEILTVETGQPKLKRSAR